MKNKRHATAEVAKLIGISRQTLQAWIGARKIQVPKAIVLGKITVRMWSDSDVQRLRKIKDKIYRKGRGRKPKGSKR
jgi:predicted DNA-binding transcriptional regulator AlpA